MEKESLEEALRREVEEETGIEISNIERIDFDEDYESDKRGEMTHYLFLVFTAKFKSGKMKASDDMKQLEWVEKSGIQKLFKKLGWI